MDMDNIVSSLLLQHPQVQSKESQRKESLAQIQHRVLEISKKIESVQSNIQQSSQHTHTSKHTSKHKSENNNQQNQQNDWTRIYDYCDKWEDLDELKELSLQEKEKMKMLESGSNLLGHCNDHGIERELFEKSEKEKMQLCERHHMLGNYLFNEGLLPKAAENYHIALSYYEYCFPEASDDQNKLDMIKVICLCNLALCEITLGSPRQALASINQAIHLIEADAAAQATNYSVECKAKAYYRRYTAHKSLHDYEQAQDDLQHAISLLPGNATLIAEYAELKGLEDAYNAKQKELAVKMLSEDKNADATSKVPSPPAFSNKATMKTAISTNCQTYSINNFNLVLGSILFHSYLYLL